MKNYQAALTYLYDYLPMYHRIGKAAYRADLKNTIVICNLLGNPQEKFKTIHVAGTNGKGSVSHILASILQSAGYKTGLYTSPHLKDFRERIKVNGKEIPENFVFDFVNQYKEPFEKTEPSFFEWTIGLAFDFFAIEKVDIAVIETGLGGRLDSTNIIHPLLSVITNISYDHTDLLGDTLAQIAVEKAGIIKETIPVVIGETHPETKNVFVSVAKEKNAPIFFADDYTSKNDFPSDLTGTYQKKNIKTVIRCIELLRKSGFMISEGKVIYGLQHVVENTGLMGRWHIFSENPLVVCDVAHNCAGIKEVVEHCGTVPYKNLHIVLGVVKDKDPEPILRQLPAYARYYFCKANIPRALDAEDLAGKAKRIGLKGVSFISVADAFKSAKKNAGAEDMILVTGSNFVVAEVL